MKAVCKKLFSLMLVAILLVSAVPFQVSADETVETVTEPAVTTEATEVTEVTEAGDIAVASLEGEASAQMPVLFGEVVTNDKRYLEYQVVLDGKEYRVGNLFPTTIGATAPTPTEDAVLAVVRSVKNSSVGYKLIRWQMASTGETFTDRTTVSLNMETVAGTNEDPTRYDPSIPIIRINAVIEQVAQMINLDSVYGTMANHQHKVMIGQPYSYYGALPIPSKTGYTFEGWYKPDGTRVTNATYVTSLDVLTARWTTGRYTVTFESHNGNTWAGVTDYTFKVDNNSVLKTDFNNFPTNADIKSMFDLPNWKIDGWEYSNDGKETWKEFKEGSTKITADTVIRPLYKKNITLYACDSGNTTRTLEVTLDKNLPILPHPGTREGIAFVGWYFDSATTNVASTKDDLSNVSKHPVATKDLSALYAGWHYAKTVYLYIHTNGNTKEHTKLVRYYDVPETGFDLTDIDLYEVFPNYGKYDDKGDEKWGWYDGAQWENFCMNKHKYETTEYVNATYLAGDDVHEFYIMLIDNGNNTSTNNNYNDNKNTVDSSNPTTGDDIFVAVTIMAVSACAVLLIFMNKKRFTK